MTPTERDVLRESLEKTVDAFFRKREAKKSKLVGVRRSKTVEIDATGVLAILSGWVGDLVAGAPEEMRDNLIFAFTQNAAEVAGILEEDCGGCVECTPAATETLQ